MGKLSSDKAIIICSRADSSRVHEKPFQKINGVPLVELLISRCLKTELPVIVAVPSRDYDKYKYLKLKFNVNNFVLFTGSAQDPLNRMFEAANSFEIKTILRVCHDKIFVEPLAVKILLEHHEKENSDYTYSDSFVAGAAIEVISIDALARAKEKYKNIEHICYAVQCVTDKIKKVNLAKVWNSDHRFLVDYPEDLKMLNVLFHSIGNDCTLNEAIQFLDANQWISKINRLPKVTVYTCAKNGEKWLNKAMGSVSSQVNFNQCEYILIDDQSTDNTFYLMNKFASVFKNTKVIKNEINVGLASSSNIALINARGKFIVRLDADDYFINDHCINDLLDSIENQNVDIVYPDNYFGAFSKVQAGNECHHVGGAIFRTRAANHVKFTEGLRGYEGLDFFIRAKESLRIGYLNKPVFFYRQHDESLTKNNLAARKELYDKLTTCLK